MTKNYCLTDADCEPEASCDLVRQQCYRARPDHPYTVMLQVYPQPDAFALVEQYNTSFRLSASDEDLTIAVPQSVTIQSRVVTNEAAIEAEVTFTPSRADVALPSSSVIVTAREKDGRNGMNNLSARLTPGAMYEVRVQPLWTFSGQLPPMMTMYNAPNELPPLSYGEMVQLRGTLRDEDKSVIKFHRVRLEKASSGVVVSSTTETDERGQFSLFAEPAVLADSEQPLKLAVSIPPFPPFRVKVELDGEQLMAGLDNDVIMPTVPSPVDARGSVKSPSAGTVPYADLQFVFSFEDSSARGTGDATGVGVDWCGFRYAENARLPVRCVARVATTADAAGAYALTLLPGIYDVFAIPASEERANEQLATDTDKRRVEPARAGLPQDGVVVTVGKAALYRGEINSFDGRPLPNTSVTARALGYPGVVGELGRYNRTVTAITDGKGRFELALDRGYFDLIVEPPRDSGFAWSGSLNRIFDEREQGGALRPMTASSPVYVSGQVQQAGSMRALTGVRIEAYALVSSLAGGQRSVRIGQASSDAEGNYRLALPATIGEELCAKGSSAKCDCGNGVSGDRECSEAGTFNTCDCPPVTDSGRRAR